MCMYGYVCVYMCMYVCTLGIKMFNETIFILFTFFSPRNPFLKKFSFIYMYPSVDDDRGQKRISDVLELELQW